MTGNLTAYNLSNLTAINQPSQITESLVNVMIILGIAIIVFAILAWAGD